MGDASARDLFKDGADFPRAARARLYSVPVRSDVGYGYTHSSARRGRAATKYKGESNFSSNARFPAENSMAVRANCDQPTTPTPTPTPFSGQWIFMPPLTGDF
jgi:hypothetical protein